MIYFEDDFSEYIDILFNNETIFKHYYDYKIGIRINSDFRNLLTFIDDLNEKRYKTKTLRKFEEYCKNLK